MRFPLPADTFPTLIVSEDDRSELQKLSQQSVYEAFDEYTNFRFRDSGVLNEERWKVIKTLEGMTSYQDVWMTDPERSRSARKERIGSGAMTSLTKLHGVLAIGAVEGDFNDMAFGLINANAETMKIKSSYTNDKVADAKVLATIVEPTLAEPIRGTYLKWCVSKVVPSLLQGIIRPRDFVYLESIGVLKTESGERIGYSLVHSLLIPNIRKLIEYRIVRANASICVLFRQAVPGKIELYVKGFVDAMGDMHQSVAIPATADALMSYSKIVYCGQMKKLNWLIKTNKTVMMAHDRVCIVCTNSARRPKSCYVCSNWMCSRCSVTKKLSFISTTTRQVSQRNLVFCVRCLLVASKTDALKIAAEELVHQNPFDFYEASANSTPVSDMVSPSSTNPPDATSEFFG